MAKAVAVVANTQGTPVVISEGKAESITKDTITVEPVILPPAVTLEAEKEVDWKAELKPEEIIKDPVTGQDYVVLAGLWRLATKKGIKHTRVHAVQVPSDANQNNATVMFEVEFLDETSFSALGNSNSNNCKDIYKNYVLTMAESRAKARACRDALNIQICSDEERNQDGDAKTPISELQKDLIKVLMGRRGVSEEEILSRGSRKVAKLEDLSKLEAASTIDYLNKMAEKIKK